jgi:chromosome segregation ATPase
MKTSIEVIEKEIDRPESILKRTTASKLDIAMLVDHIHDLHADTSNDLDMHQTMIRDLDDKITSVDNAIRSVGQNIDQCQTAVLSVKQMLDDQSHDLTAAFEGAGQEHQERYAAIDERITAMGELIRSIDERTVQQYEAMQNRIQSVEDRMPRFATEVTSLQNNVNRIELAQHKINTRIITVMRMSIVMIGVIVVTAIVLGMIFFRH